MATEIESLQIRIEAEAAKANSAIDTLASKLDTLYSSLGKLDGAKITNFAESVNWLASSLRNVATIDGRTFTALAKNINKIANVDSANLMSSAYSISSFAQAFNNLGATTTSANNVGVLASSISKLGGKNVQVAITNLPQLAQALKQLMTVLATSPKVSLNLIRMTNALASLAAQGSKVGSASKSIVHGLNSTNAAAKRTASSTKSLAAAFGKFYANYFLLIRGFKGMFNAMESAMELTETVNYFEVTLNNIGQSARENWKEYGYESADAYANSFSERLRESNEKLTGFTVSETGQISKSTFSGLGISPATATQYSAMFAQVANSIGMTEEASIALSEAFVRLGADWASLRNVDFATAYEKLASGLSGQSRALRAFGIDITMATLQEVAFANGIEKSVSEMTQAEKSYLRLIAIIEQSEVAFGDLANTLSSPANQMRYLSQGVQNLGTLVGNLFLPVLQKTLPVINGFVIAMQRIVIAISESLGIDTSGFNTSLGGMTDEFDGLTEGIDETNEVAEKFNRTTRGWDELNVLGKDNSKGYGVGNDLVKNEELLAAYNDAIEKYRKAWSEAYENINNESEAFADKIFAVLTGDKEGLYEGAENFGKNLAEFFNNTITVENFERIGETLSTVLETIIIGVVSLEENFDFKKAGEALASGINKIVANVDFTQMAEAEEKLVDGAFELIKGAFSKLDWKKFGTFAIDALTFSIAGIKLKTTGNPIGNLFLKALEKVMPEGISLRNLRIRVFDFIINAYEAIRKTGDRLKSQIEQWFDENVANGNLNIQSIAGALFDKLFNFDDTKKIGDFVGSLFSDVDNALQEKDWKRFGSDIVKGILAGLATPVVAVTEPIRNLFKLITDEIKKVFEIDKKSGNIISLGKNVAKNFVEGFKEIKTEFFLVVNDWYTKYVAPWFSEKKWNFEGIKTGLKKAFSNAIDSIKGIWNGFAEWINKALTLDFGGFEKILNLPFGQSVKIDIPAFDIQLGKLPTFATGGFPEDGLFMANHGELVGQFSNGKTAVANNEQITKGIEEAAYRGMVRALSSSNFGAHATFEVKGDPNGLFKVVQNQANQYTKSTGRNAFG